MFPVYDKAFNAKAPEEEAKVVSVVYSHAKRTIFGGCSVSRAQR